MPGWSILSESGVLSCGLGIGMFDLLFKDKKKISEKKIYFIFLLIYFVLYLY
jgi:hypothetical protein